MNQQAYQEVGKMLNAFPQQATANIKGLLLTYDEDTIGIEDQAIVEAAIRFRRGLVEGQNKTFAPSIAEFITEARRIADLLPYRGRASLPPPPREPFRHDDAKTRIRMGFKMSVLSAGLALGKADDVARANAKGLDELMALGQLWGVPIPEELWRGKAA